VTAISEQVFRMSLLKIPASNLVAGYLRGNRKNGNTIPMTVEQAIDEEKVSRTATACAYRKVAGKRMRRESFTCFASPAAIRRTKLAPVLEVSFGFGSTWTSRLRNIPSAPS
jgi:hypothetical protein